MAIRDIIVVGASLGGVRALRQLCSELPADLAAAVFIVCHTAAESPRLLAGILNDSGALPAAFAEDKEPIRSGRIYVAPPDRHLLLGQNGLHLSQDARENRFRPAIDPLFRSAAIHFGPRVIGIVLTGLLDDGTQGLWFIKRYGGICIVQDPQEAEAPNMPQSAIDEGVADHVTTLGNLPGLLSGLVGQPVAEPAAMHGDVVMSNSDEDDLSHLHPVDVQGPQVPLACPECNGTLWLGGTAGDSSPPRYQCHVGHQYSEQGLALAKREELECAIWTALRVLKENAALLGTIAERARTGGRMESAEKFERTRQEFHAKAHLIRQAIDQNRVTAR